MAIFKEHEPLESLIQRVQGFTYGSKAELKELMHAIVLHPEVKPARLVWALSHSDPKVRGFVGRWLLRRSSQEVIAPLLREMIGKPSEIREQIAKLLFRIGDAKKLCRDLGAMMHSRDAGKREAALDLLGCSKNWPALLPQLKIALRDPVPAIRQRAVRLLCRDAKEPKIFRILRELIHDRNSTIRSMVIAALAADPSPRIVEPFFERLALEGPTEQKLMISALGRLTRDPRAKLEERLLPILADENPKLREAAVKLLSQMPERTRVMRAFLVHCRGLAFWLRDRTSKSIMDIAEDLIEPLIQLMGDPEEDIRVGAMLMASSCDDKRILPRVRDIFLGKSDWWVRSVAADVLGRFPSPAVFNTLISKLDDPEMRHCVISILGLHREPGLAQYLLPCLKDRRRDIRLVTLEALENHKTPRVLEAVFATAKGDPDAAVRERAALVLSSFMPHSEKHLRELEEHRSRQRRELHASVSGLQLARPAAARPPESGKK